jgi:meiotic recombination protein REC8
VSTPVLPAQAQTNYTRPEQLMIQDDPAFLPENALPALDFDFSNLDISQKGDSQRSSQSMLSVRQRSGSVSSHAGSVLGLDIPSSSGIAGYQLPVYPFGESSAHKGFGGPGRDLFGEEALVMQDDMIFDFDDNGELRDIPESEREARRAGSGHPQGRLGSDSAASARVRKEHEEGRIPPVFDGEGDFNVQHGDDDMVLLPEADPFPALQAAQGIPFMTGGLGGNDKALHLDSEDLVHSEEPSSISAAAPQKKKKKAKAKKKTAIDGSTEINTTELSLWQKDYVAKMTAATLIKANKNAATQAKKSAFQFVYGSGLNGIGEGIGSFKLPSPLAMFSGEALLARVIGKAPPSAKLKKRTKRAPPADEDQEEAPSKRPRDSEVGRGPSPNQNTFEDDGFIMNMDDDRSIEVGRDAPSALLDHPSSIAMPWNISASLQSHQHAASSSLQGGRADILASQIGSVGGRRLTSASPLVGKGSNVPGELSQFDNEMVTYGRDDETGSQYDVGGAARGASSNQAPGSQSQHPRVDEFELFGQAANVDTQTAGSPQWVRDALDRESNNFFEYVKNTIAEKMGDELAQDGDVFGRQEFGDKSMGFEELCLPEKNSSAVASQAFYHILCLATKRRVWVTQEGVDDMEPFGEIRVGVV